MSGFTSLSIFSANFEASVILFLCEIEEASELPVVVLVAFEEGGSLAGSGQLVDVLVALAGGVVPNLKALRDSICCLRDLTWLRDCLEF